MIYRRLVGAPDSDLMKVMLFKRLVDFQHLNHVSKSLALIMFLITEDERQGNYDFTIEVKSRFEIINQLRYYKYFQGAVETGYIVRELAERIFNFLFMRDEAKSKMEAPEETMEIREEEAPEGDESGEKVKRIKKVRKVKRVKKSRRGSTPEEVTRSEFEERRSSMPQIASPVAEFNEDMFDFAEADSKVNVFDSLEEDLRSIRPEVAVQHAPVPVAAAPAEAVFYPVQYVYVPVVAPQADMLFAPKSENYYRPSAAKSGAKSLEELLKSGKKEQPAPNANKGMDFVFVEDLISQYGNGLDVKRERKVSAPQVVERRVSAPLVVEEIEVKMMEEDQPAPAPVPAPRVVAPPVAVRAPLPADANISKTQNMARFFDQVKFDAEERRSQMPEETHNGEMYLVTGMRPVKPVHTGLDN